MYGEDYDVIVEAMDKDEKVELRAKLAAKKISDNSEDLAARLRERLGSQASLGSLHDGHTEDGLNYMASSEPSYSLNSSLASPGGQVEARQMFPEVLPKSTPDPLLLHHLSSPPPSTRPLAKLTSPLPEEHYALPTKSSLHKRVPPSPLQENPRWFPASPIPGR